ncbi:MAG: MFS transporter [Candidatus Izimaplasma sp.]|nr:MFS transporter [Candidatus Izimaplasma bacterium]
MTKKLLKNKNFSILIIGNFMSLLGSNIQQFVLSLYVLDKTGSATLFASMLAISILPRIIFSPIAGVFGDWFDKKKSIVLLDTLNGVLLLGFAAIFFFDGDLSLGLIYLLVILLEVTEIFFHSSMSAVLPSVVEKEDYLEANSLRSIIVSFGQLMGPVLGALIYGGFGLLLAILINAISFLLSAISELFIEIPKIKQATNKKNFSSFKKDFVSGLQIIKNSKSIRTIIALATIINFSISPFYAIGMIYVLKEILTVGNIQIGFYQSCLTASMIIAPIIVTSKLKKAKLGNVLNISFIAVSILIALISLSTTQFMLGLGNNNNVSYIYIIVLVFIMGLFITTVNIGIYTLVQKIVPLEYMGRTSTVLGLLATIAIPIGQILFGILYDNLHSSIVILINASIILIAVLFFYNSLKNIKSEAETDFQEISNRNGGELANEF